MTERTYVRNNEDGYYEVMVWVDEDGQAVKVYAFVDNLPDIPGVTWTPGLNHLFKQAVEPDVAFGYLQEHFNHTYDQE